MEDGESVAPEDWRLECLREDQQLYVLSPRNITVTSGSDPQYHVYYCVFNNRLGDLSTVTTR